LKFRGKMEKLRFDFKMRGSADGKSSILCLTSIGTPDGRTFGLPDELQSTNLHKELITSQVFGRIKNTLDILEYFKKEKPIQESLDHFI